MLLLFEARQGTPSSRYVIVLSVSVVELSSTAHFHACTQSQFKDRKKLTTSLKSTNLGIELTGQFTFIVTAVVQHIFNK